MPKILTRLKRKDLEAIEAVIYPLGIDLDDFIKKSIAINLDILKINKTPRTKDRVVKLYNAGYSTKDISFFLNRSTTTISLHRKKAIEDGLLDKHGINCIPRRRNNG